MSISDTSWSRPNLEVQIFFCRIKIENPDYATTKKPNEVTNENENEETNEDDYNENDEDFSFLGR